MLPRPHDVQILTQRLRLFPVTVILGPRQCGKTTLAMSLPWQHLFDLENPRDLARLDNPLLALEHLDGLIVIDEIQRRPELFPLLRHLVDRHPEQRYLILGSASRDLIRQSSESLAGRVTYHELGGFSLRDVHAEHWRALWIRGQMPRSFLADTEQDSVLWRENYITTYLERDLPQLGVQIPSRTLRRFWTMLAHYHGQILNFSELGRSFGVSDVTVQRYLEILEGTFMIRLLQPWSTNTGKRLVKRPKLYLRDSGCFHVLMDVANHEQLDTHPKLGASFEGFALEMAYRATGKDAHSVYFWRTHAGADVDLFWQADGKNFAVEFKYKDAPTLTRSMLSALDDLDLTHLFVMFPGETGYRLHKRVTAVPVTAAAKPFDAWGQT